MAVKYRKSSKRRYTPRKRKMSTFKRRRSSKYTRPDGQHNERIVYQQALVNVGGRIVFYFTWLKALENGGAYGINQSVAGANNADRQFIQCATMYREYRVTGVRLDYTPSLFTSGASISALNVGTVPNTEDEPVIPSPEDLEGAYDYKSYDPTRKWHRYYHIGRWAKSKSINWQQCEDILSNPPENVPAFDCVTGIRGQCAGFADNAGIANIKVTYYVKFRSRTSSTFAGN